MFGMKKHLKNVPSSLYARQLLQHMLAKSKTPAEMNALNKILVDVQNAEIESPADRAKAAIQSIPDWQSEFGVSDAKRIGKEHGMTLRDVNSLHAEMAKNAAPSGAQVKVLDKSQTRMPVGDAMRHGEDEFAGRKR